MNLGYSIVGFKLLFEIFINTYQLIPPFYNIMITIFCVISNVNFFTIEIKEHFYF